MTTGILERLKTQQEDSSALLAKQWTTLVQDIAAGEVTRSDEEVLAELEHLGKSLAELDAAVTLYQRRESWKALIRQAAHVQQNADALQQEETALRTEADESARRLAAAKARLVEVGVELRKCGDEIATAADARSKLLDTLPANIRQQVVELSRQNQSTMGRIQDARRELFEWRDRGQATAEYRAEVERRIAAMEAEIRQTNERVQALEAEGLR